jgi:hypothetical protein
VVLDIWDPSILDNIEEVPELLGALDNEGLVNLGSIAM